MPTSVNAFVDVVKLLLGVSVAVPCQLFLEARDSCCQELSLLQGLCKQQVPRQGQGLTHSWNC